MKKYLLILALALTVTPTLLAQDHDHGEVGVFADYFRLQAAPRDLFGLGGRLSFNVHKNVQLEAEMANDFEPDLQKDSTTDPARLRSSNRA